MREIFSMKDATQAGLDPKALLATHCAIHWLKYSCFTNQLCILFEFHVFNSHDGSVAVCWSVGLKPRRSSLPKEIFHSFLAAIREQTHNGQHYIILTVAIHTCNIKHQLALITLSIVSLRI